MTQPIRHSRTRRGRILNHPILVFIFVFLWAPFQTSLLIWQESKRKLHELWQIHFVLPKEQILPRSHHVLFRTVDRPLTPPLDHPRRVGPFFKAKRQRTLDQAQSKLFNLPPELRVMIWKEIVSGYCAYPIDNQNWNLLQRRMVDRNMRHMAWALSQPSSKLFDARHGFNSRPHILALLLTCRRIYSETINLLYSSNIFHFRSGLGLLGIKDQRMFIGLTYPARRPQFIWRVLPQRFDHIRCLIIQHDIYYLPVPENHLESWIQFCTALGRLPSLQALRVELDPRVVLHDFAMSNSKLPDSFYLPLCGIRHLKMFDVVVFCAEGVTLPIPAICERPFQLAIGEHSQPLLLRRRTSQTFKHLYGDADLLSAEKWMREALAMLRASSI